MKNIALIIIMMFAGQTTFAQEQKFDWKSMKPDQRKDIIQRMSPQERQSLLRQFRQNLVVSEIDVPESKEEEFKSLYNEYQDKQNEIKSRFKPSNNYDSMTDDEAKQHLNQSFEVGQQLLDNRKAYAQKFLKVIKPQQVLQMYQTEGKVRNKILNGKPDGFNRPQNNRP